MAKNEEFSILPLEYFAYKNPYSGSCGNFNYKIVPKDSFRLMIWYGKLCSAKSEIVAEAEFPLEEESRPLICEWLNNQYKIFELWQLKQNEDE